MITASIVVFHNKWDDIQKVLLSALRSSINMVFIIDHGDDKTLEDKFKDHPNVVYIKHENLGYGSGHNIGIQKAIEIGSKYHVVLNPDIYWDEPVIETLAGYMDTHPDVGHMMPKVKYPDGSIQYLVKLLPTPKDIFIREFGNKSFKDKVDRHFALKGADYDSIIEAPNLSGCFMFLRVDILKSVGGFDDRFFMYFEDTDLGRRIGMVSKLVYLPTTTIIHAHAAEHKKSLKMKIIGMKSAIKYFNKWGWLFDSYRSKVNKRCFETYGSKNT